MFNKINVDFLNVLHSQNIQISPKKTNFMIKIKKDENQNALNKVKLRS